MSNDDDTFMALLLYVGAGIFFLLVMFHWAAHMNECKPGEAGHVRVIGKYGGDAQVCNGRNWVPYIVPIPKQDDQ